MPCRRVLTLSYRKLILVSNLYFIWIHLVTLRQSMQSEWCRDFIEEVGLALGQIRTHVPIKDGRAARASSIGFALHTYREHQSQQL